MFVLKQAFLIEPSTAYGTLLPSFICIKYLEKHYRMNIDFSFAYHGTFADQPKN